LKIKKKSYLFVFVLYLFLTLFPSISSAHAYIIVSSPSENETLKMSPNEVTIQFDEPIQPKFYSIKVTNSNGKRVDKKNGRIDPNQPTILKTGLKKNLPNGTYRIQWKVISNDGHPVEGVIPFQIGTGVVQDSLSYNNETKTYIPHTDLIIIRWLQYISNACYVGLFFFYLMVVPKELLQASPTEKTLLKFLWTGFLLLALSIILSLPLQATIVLGSRWSEVFSFDALGQVLSYTVFGKIWLIQMALLFTLALTTHFLSMADATKRLISWVCFCLGIGILATKAFTSHAASQANNLLSISMDFLHLLAASIWIGSLIGLVVLLPLSKNVETKPYYLKMVHRFSKWAIILVLLLAATGVFNGFQYIPTISSLFHTDYGRVLVSKVILFFIMLIFAAINFIKGKMANAKGLGPSLWGEVTIGIIILILTVILTNLPPAMSSPGPYEQTNVGGLGYKVSLEVTPNVIGENAYIVSLKNAKDKPIKSIEQITLTLSHAEMDMGKDTITLSKVGEGKYEAKGLNFNMSGKWNVHVHVLTKTLDSIDTDFRLSVGSR
jgi:copper transport protein